MIRRTRRSLMTWALAVLLPVCTGGLGSVLVANASTSRAVPSLHASMTVKASRSGYGLVDVTSALPIKDIDDASRVHLKLPSGTKFGGFALIPDTTQYATAGVETVPPILIAPYLPGRPQGSMPFLFGGADPNGSAASAVRQLPAGHYRFYVFTQGPVTVTVNFAGAPAGSAKLRAKKAASVAFQGFHAGSGAPGGSFVATDKLSATGFVFDALWYSANAELGHYNNMCVYPGGPVIYPGTPSNATVEKVPFCSNNTPNGDQSFAIETSQYGDLFSGPLFGLSSGTYGNQLTWDSAGTVADAGAMMLWISKP